jgi:hypothetical protein
MSVLAFIAHLSATSPRAGTNATPDVVLGKTSYDELMDRRTMTFVIALAIQVRF